LNSVNDGTLTVPPPLLTRVAQQMEQGMMSYRQVLLIKATPFPFPYTQICWVLVIINMIGTPFMMCSYTDEAWVAALFTMISIVCINTIHMIATEIENPLGDDTNDLPCHEYHDAFNEHLALLLHPGTLTPPLLLPTAIVDADLLLDPKQPKGLSLRQYFITRGPVSSEIKGVGAEEKDDGAVVLNVSDEQAPDLMLAAAAAATQAPQVPSATRGRPPEAGEQEQDDGAGVSNIMAEQASDVMLAADAAMNLPSASTEGNSSQLPSADPIGLFLGDFSRKMLESQTELNSTLIRQVQAVEKLLSATPRSLGHDPSSNLDAHASKWLDCRENSVWSCASTDFATASQPPFTKHTSAGKASSIAAHRLAFIPQSPQKVMRAVSPTKSFFSLPRSPKKFSMALTHSPKKGGA